MDIKNLEQFGQQINILLEHYIRTKQENVQLKEAHTRVLLENKNLRKKQIHLGERIESIIQRLKQSAKGYQS